jgi:hypothetical protein
MVSNEEIEVHDLETLERVLALEFESNENEVSPDGFVVASPSGFAWASPSGLAITSPSGLAITSPSGLAVVSPSGFAGV